jgi:hypothetical protein
MYRETLEGEGNCEKREMRGEGEDIRRKDT